MPNIDNLKKYKNIHMIGIGGVSMSGIAEILHNWGFQITGSDLSDSESVQILKQTPARGIRVLSWTYHLSGFFRTKNAPGFSTEGMEKQYYLIKERYRRFVLLYQNLCGKATVFCFLSRRIKISIHTFSVPKASV